MGRYLSIVRWVADLLLAPFFWLPPLVGLALLAAVLGLLLLVAFRWLSPQRRLARVKDQMMAAIYEMRIFSHAPRLVLAASARSLRYLGEYLALTLLALVVLAPLVGLLMVRIAGFYDYRPLSSGAPALVTVELDAIPPTGPLAVEASQGVEVLQPLLVVEQPAELVVRVQPTRPGRHELTIRAGKDVLHKRLLAGPQPIAVSPVRTRSGLLDSLLSHEPPLPPGIVQQIRLDYERKSSCWFGVPWWGILLLISTAVAFALRRRFGVVF